MSNSPHAIATNAARNATPTADLPALQVSAPPAIAVEDLTVSYRQHPAVHHLSCRFEPGSLTAVIGPNGAGKSSLLDALTGRVQPTTGRVHTAGLPRTALAYLPQQSGIDRSFPLGVLDVVMLGAWPRIGWLRGASAAQRDAALRALAAVGLAGFDSRLIAELSVGQFQRVLFARVLVQDAPVVLLDEPFNAIDTRTTADLMRLVQQWHAEGRTVIAVLHDLAQVREFFPLTLLLARECVAHGPTAAVLAPQHLLRAQQMAEQWDEHADWCGATAGAAR
jgi:zinc/manganese transport system ATP-binding protein